MDTLEVLQLVTAALLTPIWVELREMRKTLTKNTIDIAKLQVQNYG